jgi:broad specificity phosphatase PhoE
MTTIYLVRHAEPVISPGGPPEGWQLSPAGWQGSARLAEGLDLNGIRIFASPQVKTMQTAEAFARIAGVQTEPAAGLREVGGRAWVAGGRAEYEAAVRRYFEGETGAGWEPRGAAQERIVDAIAALALGGDALVVSHGLVLTLALAWLQSVEPAILFPVWQSMRFTDLCTVDWEGRAVLRRFGQPL